MHFETNCYLSNKVLFVILPPLYFYIKIDLRFLNSEYKVLSFSHLMGNTVGI